MSLVLSAAADRPLVASGEQSERYLMLTLQAREGTAQRLPLHLALVIDRSGSMSGAKLARAKEAASFVVRHLSSADRVAVIAYDDQVEVVAPSTAVTPEARVDLLYRVSRIEAGGSTNLCGGWLMGCQEVARHQSDEQHLYRTLVLTDGLANVGVTKSDEVVAHARELRVRGIVTSTMGVGVDFNEELLAAMARHGGGRFQYVETAQHIPDCIQGELGEMLQVSARKVAVEVTFPPGIRYLECLNDYVVEEARSGVRVHLGDLIAGERRPVVLKVSVEPDSAGTAQALAVEGLAMYVDTQTGHGTEAAFPTTELRFADAAPVEGQAADEEVTREVALLVAARAKEEAARLSREGDDIGASFLLRRVGSALQASASVADPAVASEAALLMSQAEEARQGLGEHQLKELHYQSYLGKQARRRYDPPRG